MTNEEKNEEIKGVAMVILAGISASEGGSSRIMGLSSMNKDILIDDVFEMATLFIEKANKLETENP